MKNIFLLIIILLLVACEKSELHDPSGNIYKTVKVGNQIWMNENLKIDIKDGSIHYNNDQTETERMGMLYNYEGALKAAEKIEGWRLPSKKDWEEFLEIIGKSKEGYENLASGKFGFSTQWAGVGFPSGKFKAKGVNIVYYWSSTICDTNRTRSYNVGIMGNIKTISPHNYQQKNYCSVRLIKN